MNCLTLSFNSVSQIDIQTSDKEGQCRRILMHTIYLNSVQQPDIYLVRSSSGQLWVGELDSLWHQLTRSALWKHIYQYIHMVCAKRKKGRLFLQNYDSVPVAYKLPSLAPAYYIKQWDSSFIWATLISTVKSRNKTLVSLDKMIESSAIFGT